MSRDYIKIPDEVINDIKRNTTPMCFYCGTSYVKDHKYSKDGYTTWRPYCSCISKSTIKVMTGPAS